MKSNLLISLFFLVLAFFYSKSAPLKVLVLPCSYYQYDFPVYRQINNNWQLYGNTEVYINYTVASLRNFTYNDLIWADVLLLSDNAGENCVLDASEVGALQKYAQEGHNIVGTYLIFSAEQYGIESLFGFNVIGGARETSNTVSHLWSYDSSHANLFAHLENPFQTHSYDGVVIPTVGWKSILNQAVPAAINSDSSGVISVYNAASYIAVYIAYMPEYSGTLNDTQLLYNALTIKKSCSAASTCNACTQQGCTWCLDTQTCISETNNCRSYIKNPNFCPALKCGIFNSCTSCVSNGNNKYCDWCLETKQCITLQQSPTCQDVINDPQFCTLKH